MKFYLFQPIASRLKFYDDLLPQNADLRNRDRQKWDEISAKLHGILVTSSQQAVAKGMVDENVVEKYRISGKSMHMSTTLELCPSCYYQCCGLLQQYEVKKDALSMVMLQSQKMRYIMACWSLPTSPKKLCAILDT